MAKSWKMYTSIRSGSVGITPQSPPFIHLLTSLRDGFTPNQDFIISPHPHCQNLYIATAGSYHGWKFLPVIGEYVVQLLGGTLEEDLVKRWAWDRPQEGGAHEKIKPKRELRDLL